MAFLDRNIIPQLANWKASEFRKPLILKGARQVGKTRALKEFGRLHYDNVAYVSLENVAPGVPSEYTQFFESTNDPKRIVENLSFAIGQPIRPGSTLIVLDEIQDCPAAIGSLKYFCEDAPEYHVACAGSLLGVKHASESAFPVGKVSFLQQYPLSFSEYLCATGAGQLAAFCKQLDSLTALPPAFANPLGEKLQSYFALGGMPEVVSRWVDTGDMNQIQDVLSDLVDSYERDFAKHGGKVQYAKISLVWNSLPSQLSRENKKFLYGLVKKVARAREYEDAIQWLVNAGLVYKTPRSTAPGPPISAYDDLRAFKLYCVDVGVLRRLARLSPTVFAEGNAVFSELKGSFAENYTLQALLPQLDGYPRYWTNEKPPHEIDYLIQIGNSIIPIEVKTGTNTDSASLRYYHRKYEKQTPLRVRFSLKNLSFDGGLLNIPLYLADESCRLIELALQQVDAAL